MYAIILRIIDPKLIVLNEFEIHIIFMFAITTIHENVVIP